MIKSLYIVTFLLGFTSAIAQPDLTLHYMKQLPQSSHFNMGSMPDNKLYIGFPALSSSYFQIGNSGFSLHNAITKRNEDDSLVLDLDNMLDKMNKRNFISFNVNNELLHLGFKSGENNYFNLGITEKISSQTVYTRDLFEFIINGNQPFIGERASFDAMGVNLIHYREFFFGMVRRINDDFSIGGRLKYLYGMENIHTRSSSLGLHTDNESFDLTVDGSFNIYTSGFSQYMDTTVKDPFVVNNYIFGLNNHGLAIDAGINYKIEQFLINFSITDLGFIKWKDNIKNISADRFEYTFRGVDIRDVYENPDKYENFNFNDTVNQVFNIEESDEAYTTGLRMHAFTGVGMEVTSRGTAYLLLHNEFVKGFPRNEYSIQYHHRFGNALHLSGSYSIINSTFTNIGMGISVGGPVQFYAVTDNIFGFIVPHRVRHASLRFGFNLTFGREKFGKESLDE